MFPVKDENPSSITPVVTWLLIVSCVSIFVWQFAGDFDRIILGYGFTPARIANGEGYYTLITSMFLHGGILHLFGNMLYLYIFGDNVEDMCGHLSFFVFYMLSGVLASLVFALTSWGSTVPAVGASGAISGVLGGYMVLFPKVRIKTAVTLGWFIRLIYVPAYVMIGLWFGYQFLLALLAVETGTAYWAHIGGFAAGVALVKVFARRKRYHPMYYLR